MYLLMLPHIAIVVIFTSSNTRVYNIVRLKFIDYIKYSNYT